MTVNVSSNRSPIYAGDGSNTRFDFDFPGVEASAISVTLIDSHGVESVIPPSNYFLFLNPPVFPNPTQVGGYVIYPPIGSGASPIPLGTSLFVERDLPLVQDTSLQNQGTLWQAVIEQALDYLTLCIQQVQGAIGRFIEAPVSDPAGLNYVLPSVQARAGNALLFDSSGNVTTGSIPTGAFISAVMVPVVEAATLADQPGPPVIPGARTQMGLGNVSTTNVSNGLSVQPPVANGNLIVIEDPILDVAGTITVNAGFHATTRAVTGSGTKYILPSINSLWFGWWMDVIVNSIYVTLVPNGADQINYAPGGQPVQFGLGTKFRITTRTGTDTVWHVTELSQNPTPPGGYLSIIQGNNVPFTDAAAGVIYYNPDVSGRVPVWVGDNIGSSGDFVDQLIPQPSIGVTLNATQHPALGIFDIFAYNDPSGVATTLQFGAGRGWSTINSRTDNLIRLRGVYVNAANITLTNGSASVNVPIFQATYLGTFRCTSAGQTMCNTVGTTQNAVWYVWNMYNRREISLRIADPNTAGAGAPWSTTSAIGPRASNNNLANSVNVLLGLAEERVFCDVSQSVAVQGGLITSGTVIAPTIFIGVGLGTSGAFSSAVAAVTGGSYVATLTGAQQLTVTFPAVASAAGDLGTWLGVEQIVAVEQASNLGGGAAFFYPNGVAQIRWRG